MKRSKLLALGTIGLVFGFALGGLVSTAFAAPRPQPPLITLDMLTPTQGWAMNSVGQILKTADGGRRWANVGNPALARAIQHAAKDGSFYLPGPKV